MQRAFLLGYHAVEGGDLGQLPAQRLFAGEAHGEEHEAVAGHAKSRLLPHTTVTDYDLLEHARKIARMFFWGFNSKIANSAHHLPDQEEVVDRAGLVDW